MGANDNKISKTISKDNIRKIKRLLTDRELDEYIKLDDNKKQKKYLEKLEKELWELKVV